MTSLTARNAATFLGATDRDGARRFFRDVLGFTLTAEDPFALVFSLANTTLRVSPVQGFKPQQFTVLGWDVPDIAAAVTELTKAGIVFERFPGMEQDAQGIWTAPGGAARVAWFKDPSGNVLSVAQH